MKDPASTSAQIEPAKRLDLFLLLAAHSTFCRHCDAFLCTSRFHCRKSSASGARLLPLCNLRCCCCCRRRHLLLLFFCPFTTRRSSPLCSFGSGSLRSLLFSSSHSVRLRLLYSASTQDALDFLTHDVGLICS